MSIIMAPSTKTCGTCKHYRGLKGGGIDENGNVLDAVPTCAAFEKGIPGDVWTAKALHRSPMKGDGGITYEEGAADGAEE